VESKEMILQHGKMITGLELMIWDFLYQMEDATQRLPG